MIRSMPAAAVLATVLLAPVPGLAGVQVRFIHPERYVDAESFGAGSREATLAALRALIEKTAARFLAPSQTLTIDVLDVDLAGEYEPWRGSLSDVRIMRAITPPSFRLRYVLTERGRVVRRGEDVLTDVNYQMDLSARASGDRFRYEQALLADWFRQHFARP